MTSVVGEGFQLVDRSCPLCGSSSGHVAAAANVRLEKLDAFAFASRKIPEYMHHRLVMCNRCDLLYASPAPTTESLFDAYAGADYDSGEESRYASATYSTLLRELVGPKALSGPALDIGTGDGAFLAALAALGIDDAIGVEPSLAPVATAPAAIQRKIRQGPFRAEDFPPGHFGLVTSFQTLEHIADPVATCRGAHDLLRDGGAVLVVGHNRRAPLNKLAGRRSPIYDIEHLQLFSPVSLRSLLERCGFSDIRVRPVVNRYPARYWARLLPLPQRAKAILLSVLDRTRLSGLPVSLPVGNIAAVGFKGGRPTEATSVTDGRRFPQAGVPGQE
jgi:SAM-dependent methyltransferase